MSDNIAEARSLGCARCHDRARPGSIIQYSQEQRFRYVVFLGSVPYSQTSVSFNMRMIDTSNAKAVYLCSGENSEEDQTYLNTAGKIIDLALEPLSSPDMYGGGETIRR
jgi:hypothetical protein